MPNTDPLRIIHVLRAPMGGVLRHVRDLTVAHEEMGHAVGIVCDLPGTPGYGEDTVAELERRASLGVARVAMRREVGPRDLIDARKILRILKELKPNVLHGHGAKGGVFARALGSLVRAERSRVARLYSPHGGSLHFDPRSGAGRLFFAAERLLEKATDHILFVADFEHRAYADKIGEPACAWSVNHNGLRDEEFAPVTPADDAADFLFLGELRMLKGPDLFLRALAKLRAAGQSGARAVIVGNGPDRSRIRALSVELGLGDAVDFRDPMTAHQAFALARTFVMPSRAEAFPYVVLEALGARMPVIATDVGGVPEIFGIANPALAAPESDSLSELMALSIENPDTLREWMPSIGDMRRRFSVEKMAGNALSAYRGALTIEPAKLS